MVSLSVPHPYDLGSSSADPFRLVAARHQLDRATGCSSQKGSGHPLRKPSSIFLRCAPCRRFPFGDWLTPLLNFYNQDPERVPLSEPSLILGSETKLPLFFHQSSNSDLKNLWRHFELPRHTESAARHQGNMLFERGQSSQSPPNIPKTT